MPSSKYLLESQYQDLIKAIGVPSEFLSVFRRLVSLEELQVLYFLTGEFLTVSNVKEKLVTKKSTKISSILERLFQRGFLKKKIVNNESAYKCQRFYGIMSLHLREHRYSIIGPLELNPLRRYYLNTLIANTENAITTGQLKYSSEVIPINKAFILSQHILPINQAIQTLEKSHFITLTNCGCRVAFENCDNPIETCLILNEVGENSVSRGYGRKISIKKARKVLEIANQAGLVHLSIFLPGQEVYAICSCCSCCCHEFQALLKFNKSFFIAKTDYMAIVNPDECDGCLACIKRCLFGAREEDNGISMINKEKCYGCGLCVTSCPTKATQLVPRTSN